jgi:hypothetical protein
VAVGLAGLRGGQGTSWWPRRANATHMMIMASAAQITTMRVWRGEPSGGVPHSGIGPSQQDGEQQNHRAADNERGG